MLVNEFMNKGFFDLEKKFDEAFDATSMIDWPHRGGLDEVIRLIKFYRLDLMRGLSSVLSNVEQYIQQKLALMRKLKGLRFTLFAMLQRAVVPHHTTIPDVPSLSFELQTSLNK